MDELGVLLGRKDRRAYWFGSQLTIDQARALAPHNSATTLQVTSSIMAAMVWAMENADRGIVTPDEVDFRRVLELATPYLGTVVGVYTDWTPVYQRGEIFDEDVDHADPWQFKNVVV
jgi:homospermidine synthase